jgi:hypothetical protein
MRFNPSLWAMLAIPALILLTASCRQRKLTSGADRVSSIVGIADFEDVEAYIKDRNLDSQSAIARIINSVAVINDGCTGWLLTSKYLVTNQHCVVEDFRHVKSGHHYGAFDQVVCDKMTIVFDKQVALDPPNYRRPPSGIFHCARVVFANMAHEFAIIEIAEPLPAEFVPLRVAKSFKVNHQELMVVGQPGGGVKKISYRNRVDGQSGQRFVPCRARAARFMNGGDGSDDPHPYERPKNTNSFAHDCDTIGGNSGSPVLDAGTLDVVGLHWSGWLLCKWPHYDPDGSIDNTNQIRGHGNEDPVGMRANQMADSVPYRQGNTAIDIARLRDLIIAMPVGSTLGQVPADIKRAFE